MKRPQATDSESNQRIYDFLVSHPIGVLATTDPNHNPHAAAIYYSVDQEFNITFSTKHDTKKHDNLVHHNKAMLIAYDGETQTTAQITGTTEDISGTPQAQETFQNTLRASEQTSSSSVPPISKLYAGPYVAWRLNPVQIRMAVFIRPDPGSYDMYETIDFSG